MGLFDIFTGSAATKAAGQTRSYLDQLQSGVGGQLGGYLSSGLGSLQAGTQGALGALGSGYNQAQNYISQYTPQALEALYGQTNQGVNALQGAVDPALQALYGGVNKAVGAYQPLSELGARFGSMGSQAAQASMDALGLNGPEGTARAQASFKAGPGYDYAVSQGINATTRGANAAGMAASGNTLAALQSRGNDLANQEYDKYRQGLYGQQSLYEPLAATTTGAAAQGIGNAYLTGGTGASNIYTGTAGRIADLLGSAGRTGAGILQGAGNTLGSLAAGGGQALANAFSQGGQGAAELYRQFAGLQSGLAGQLAQPYANTYSQEAAAKQTGSAQLWDLIGNAAKGAAGGGYLNQFGGSGLQNYFQSQRPYFNR